MKHVRMVSGLFVLVSISFLIATLYGAGVGASRPVVRLQLQWFDQAQFAGFYAAKAKGFFADEGIEVNLIPGSYAIKPVRQIETGAADIAVAPADQTLIAIAENKPLKVLGTVFNKSVVCFMSKKDLKIVNVTDLKGHRVAIYGGFDTENILKILLGKFRIKESELASIVQAGALQMFETDGVEVWPSYRFNEPLLMQAKGIETECLKPENFGVSYYSDTLVTSGEYLSKHRNSVERFLRASAKGWRWAAGNPSDAIDLMFERRLGLSLTDTPSSRAHQLAMLKEAVQHMNLGADAAVFATERIKWNEMAHSMQGIGLLSVRDLESLTDKSIDFDIAHKSKP